MLVGGRKESGEVKLRIRNTKHYFGLLLVPSESAGWNWIEWAVNKYMINCSWWARGSDEKPLVKVFE